MNATANRAPYKLVTEEPDRAGVIERATDREIGYVVLWSHGWAAYLDSDPGWSLPFGWRPVEARITEALGWRMRPLLFTRYRSDAAARVWTAHMEGR